MRRTISVLVLFAALTAPALAVVGIAQPSSAQPEAHPSAADTRFAFVRPVTASGRPAAGWAVRRESGSVQCDGESPSAVNPGIASCYPTAYGLRACWKSRHHTVLCVTDARERTLTRIRYTGRFPAVVARAEPAPMDLELGDGRDCLIREGGAWGSPAEHRQWLGYYSCTRSASVYGPPRSTDGVDRSRDRWRVRLWDSAEDPQGERLVRRDVVRAFYVGNAAEPARS